MDSGCQNERSDQEYRTYIPMEIPIPDRNGRQQKKDSTARILILGACIGALLFAAGAGIVYFINTPSYKIGRGFRNLAKEIAQSRNPLAEKTGIEELMLMMAEEGFHMDTRINLTSESLPARVNTIGIDADCSRDVKNREMSAGTSISVMNYDFAHLNFYTDNEDFCFSVPELFLENMYFENRNVVSQYNESFWAQLTGPIDAEDFSLDFFPEEGERFSRQDWKDGSGFLERYAADLEACRSGMIIEKAEKGVYRVVLPGKETDHLLQNIMDHYGQANQTGMAGQFRKEYDSLIHSDISILLDINGKNRIENIRLEEPVRLMDGTVSIGGWLSFMGNVRSIDSVVGVITTEGDKDMEPAATFQFLQTPEAEQYESELYAAVFDGEDTLVEMKYMMASDAVSDQIGRRLSVWNEEESMDILLKGSLDDIVRGESLTLDLEEMTFQWNGKVLFKLTGDFLIEPLTGEAARIVKKETAFFKMTERDWWDIVRRINEEYGGLLRYLW